MEGYCDKKRAACGVGRVIVSLDRQTLALVRIGAATATGDEAKLRDRMIAARTVDVPPQWVDELLLQSFLNVGYPLALVAFGVWRSIEGPRQETMEDERIAHPDWERWTTRGVEACAEVYGRTFHKLMLNLRALHPAIEPLVVVDAYGKILGRPGLDSKKRELCTLAAIAMQNAPRQLHAHLRGALNTGSTRDEVDEVIALVEDDLTKDRALKLWEMWADVRERNL